MHRVERLMEDCKYLVLALDWTRERFQWMEIQGGKVLAARRGASLAVDGWKPWFHGQWRWCPWGGGESEWEELMLCCVFEREWGEKEQPQRRRRAFWTHTHGHEAVGPQEDALERRRWPALLADPETTWRTVRQELSASRLSALT
jgi:hypothetical protein